MNGLPFTPETWQTIRAAYESGKYSSCTDIYNNISMLFPDRTLDDLPTLCTIMDKRSSEKWNINRKSDEIFKDIFEKMGCSFEKVAAVNIAAMTAEYTKITPSNQVDSDGNKEPGFAEIVPDHKIRLEAIKVWQSLTGTKAVDKSEIDAKVSGDTLPKQIEIILIKPSKIDQNKLELEV